MDNQQQDTTRAAAYLAAKERLDLRGAKSTRTGKTRNSVNCTAGNKRCGNRCIPNNWDCRLEGKGTNSELASHKTDPLAGIASIQRGSKDLFQGVVRVNPAQVQRGRNSLIRGTVKLAPGNNLEQKKQLKKQLTEASTPIMAVLGVTLVGLAGHAGLKKGFAVYRNGVGAQIDRAATTAVDSILDRMPGTAGKRAATRAAGATALGQIGGAVTRGQRLEQTRVATSGNTGRIGPLSFRPNAANEEASFLKDNMVKLRQRAKAGQLSYDEYRSKAVETLYGATNQGSRLNGQKGSIFSEHAANEFLVSKYKLNGVGAVGANAGESIANRNRLVDTQIAERLGTWGETMRSDMKLRRMTGPQGEIRARDIDQYIRTVGGGSLNQSFAGMNAAQRNQASGEARQLMRSVLGGNDLKKEAKSMRLALVSQFDIYFENNAQMMRRNAAASDSPFGDGMTGLARYVRRTTNNPGPILSRDHADLIVRNDYHERVMKLRSDYTIGENTARRIAQQITRSPDLPDADTAFRVLNNNGFPRLSRTGSTTGKAAPELRNLSQVARDILARQGNEQMTPAAAEREARRIIAERGDSTDSGLPPRVEAYLAARQDFQQGQRLGKPCGESNIPKSHKCSKGQGAEAPAKKGNNTAIKVAGVAAAAGLTTAGILAYRGRSKLVPGLSQSSIRALSAKEVKAGLDKLPQQFQEPARKLVGDAKKAAAHMALRAQGAQIKAVDIDNNFSTWVTGNGTHLSIGSVGDSLLTFGAERHGDVGKFPQYGFGFTVDTSFDAAGGMPSSQAKQLIKTTKAMFKSQMEMLPDDAFLFAVPHKGDGLGGKRKSIYEKSGFRPLPNLKTDRLWALKNQGKFTPIPDEQVDYIRNMVRGDEAEQGGFLKKTPQVAHGPA
jgi:hypothetical protein